MRDQDDPVERFLQSEVTDGFPVVPPTPAKVSRTIDAACRDAAEVIALVPPNLGRATVQKIAINAVMAGCKPEYISVVIAGVEAMCDDAFALQGVLATTAFAAPLFIVNGPARKKYGINCGAGMFGPGWRANATIGRALQLVCLNIGGAKPGSICMSTMSHPGRYTYCIGENEEDSPFEPLHTDYGYSLSDSTIAVFAGEAPHGVYDHSSRSARELLTTVAHSLGVIWNPRATSLGDTIIVLSPEHARTISKDGWKKKDIRDFLFAACRKAVKDLCGPEGADGLDGLDGLPDDVVARFSDPKREETLIPKFRGPGNLKIIVGGGTAGRFSAIVPGWTFAGGSQLVIKAIST